MQPARSGAEQADRVLQDIGHHQRYPQRRRVRPATEIRLIQSRQEHPSDSSSARSSPPVLLVNEILQMKTRIFIASPFPASRSSICSTRRLWFLF
jgi:hypothetical protein